MSTQEVEMIVGAIPLVAASLVMLIGKPTSRRSLYVLGAGLLYAAGYLAVFHQALGAPGR